MKKSLAQLREENEGAFTLVELLVVILIIGILAAIAIPAFLNQRKAAVDSSVQSDVKNAATQVETWMAANPSTAVPTFQVKDAGYTATLHTSSAGTAPANTALSQIKVSSGTAIVVKPGTDRGTYTIEGLNAGGDKSNVADAAGEQGIRYISASGGLQK